MLRHVSQTVVVVDDDDAIREAMIDLLSLDGFDVLCARDGAEALDVLGKAPRPCIAIVDLVMPRLNGWQLARAIMSESALHDIGVVCCTAGRSEAPAGCISILRKPFDADTLVTAVHEAFVQARSNKVAE
jgi:CheY-like chemotaxis protein